MEAGVMAMPPLMSVTELLKKGSSAFLRGVFGGEPNQGIPATNPSGNVDIPVLYVCGSEDGSILCNQPYALKTEEFFDGAIPILKLNVGIVFYLVRRRRRYKRSWLVLWIS